MRKLPTGEPCAGDPHARFGGRGRRQPFPTPIRRGLELAPRLKHSGGDAFKTNFIAEVCREPFDHQEWSGSAFSMSAVFPRSRLLQRS
jgi:hypothetical protein